MKQRRRKPKFDQYKYTKLLVKRSIERMLLAPGVSGSYRKGIRSALKYDYDIDELRRLQQEIKQEVDRSVASNR